MVILGIVAANLAAWPAIALAFPALMLINATFFHVLPFIRLRGRFSPGLFTAIVLFYPVGIACYVRAAADGVLSLAALITSFVIQSNASSADIVEAVIRARKNFKGSGRPTFFTTDDIITDLLLIKDKPYFRQDR